MKLRGFGLSVGLLAALPLACSSTTNNVTNTVDAGGGGDGGGGGGDSGGDTGTTGDGGATGPLPFKPSNIDLGGWDLSQVGDVDLSGTNCVLDSEQPDGLVAVLCDTPFTNKVVHKIVTLSDQTRLSVFVMKSLRVEASTVFSFSRGHLPVVLVALQTVELLGSIDVAPGTTGGAFNTGGVKDIKGSGPGGGTGGDTTGLAGGGASYCGSGGKAGTATPAGTPPPSPTATYGSPEIVPLLPGSAGGSGALTDDTASGGGAVQIVAGVSFALHTGGFVNAGGGGGAFGGLGTDGAGGGGSGGAILVESPTVTIEGKIAANGGGGGQGNGDTGESGHIDVVAQGGHKTTGTVGAPGGSGSFAATLSGSDGPSSATTSAGGGGGGAGRIRINTTSGAATISGAASPAVASACLTQGKLAK